MDSLLEVQGVSKHYLVPAGGVLRRRHRVLKALDGVSFSVPRGSFFGIAGESGSGKTTLAKLILLLEKPTAGHILFEGEDIHRFSPSGVAEYRTRAQTVFQDASSSLNPRLAIREIIGEPMEAQNRGVTSTQLRARVEMMMKLVGLGSVSPKRLPHELSGGQKQRVAIARALIVEPSLVVLDEPVSSLDVSIRAQILNLLADIRERENLTYVIVAHDLALMRQVTSHIVVLYLGKIMEMGETERVFDNPMHPYTRSLLAAVPQPVPRKGPRREVVPGEIGSPLDPPAGCRFHPRCPCACRSCGAEEVDLMRVEDAHWVACREALTAAEREAESTAGAPG
jgi:oligopeptide/dipeptide ABC transporter ATP-binding protein